VGQYHRSVPQRGLRPRQWRHHHVKVSLGIDWGVLWAGCMSLYLYPASPKQ
jgi:hypothetical protein